MILSLIKTITGILGLKETIEIILDFLKFVDIIVRGKEVSIIKWTICIFISWDYIINVMSQVDYIISQWNCVLFGWTLDIIIKIWSNNYMSIQHLNMYLMLILVISLCTLIYITLIDKKFKDKHPILYWVLLIICVVLIINISIYFFVAFINSLYKFKEMFKLWMEGRGYIGKGRASGTSGPSGSEGSSGPKGQGGPGGGQGGTTPTYDNSNKRKRSNSDSGSDSGSDSEYSDVVKPQDTNWRKDKKFANFLFDQKLKRDDKASRVSFDASSSNPVNWNPTGSPENQALGYEIQKRILAKKAEWLKHADPTIRHKDSFKYNDIGFKANTIEYRRMSYILSGADAQENFQNFVICGPALEGSKIKTIMNAK